VECPGPPLRPAGCRARLNRRDEPRPSLALWAARGGSARPLAFACAHVSPCGSGRFAPCGRVREGPALAGTAPLAPKSRGGRRCARSPRPAWPLRSLALRLVHSALFAVHGRRRHRSACGAALPPSPTAPGVRRSAVSAPGQLRSLRSLRVACRSLRLRLAASVPLLRRCTATARRQARVARLLRGLAPRARTRAAKKKISPP
jgi:hypothetical protein